MTRNHPRNTSNLHRRRPVPGAGRAPRAPGPVLAILLSALLLAFLPAVAAAAPVELYSGEVPVADKGEAERERALPLALEQVLQKLSGLAGFVDHPEVGLTLERAPAMLITYYYRVAEFTLADGSDADQLRLVARFAPAQVDDLARALGLPLWQPERPPLTTWLVVDDGVDRRIMPVEFRYVRDSMGDVAAQRGLTLRWPEPGPEGDWGVDTQLLWGGYTEDLQTRPGAGVMIAAARREGASWAVRINLAYRGEQWAWRFEDYDLQAAMNAVMHQVVDQVAAANTIAASDLGSWEQTLTVTGLRGAADYQRCLAYLQGLSVVERIDVVSAQPGAVTFRLALSALPRYLDDALATGKVLELREESPASGPLYGLVGPESDEL